MSEKLQKVLARAGYGSRRAIETMIMQKRINLDDKIATLGDRIDIHQSIKIRLDGRLLSITESKSAICRLIAYYKPEGELCTLYDPQGRSTVFDRLPKIRTSRWVTVGRLDINTSGLLLLTTDGEFANRLMHPRHSIEREYAVRVFGKIDKDKIRRLRQGIKLEDRLTSFQKICFQGGEGINQWYKVTLTEGRNREIRRLWKAVNVTVNRLIRIRYGNINLPKGLPRGGWLELDLKEINYLRELVSLSSETVSKLPIERKFNRIKANRIRRKVKLYSGRMMDDDRQEKRRCL